MFDAFRFPLVTRISHRNRKWKWTHVGGRWGTCFGPTDKDGGPGDAENACGQREIRPDAVGVARLGHDGCDGICCPRRWSGAIHRVSHTGTERNAGASRCRRPIWVGQPAAGGPPPPGFFVSDAAKGFAYEVVISVDTTEVAGGGFRLKHGKTRSWFVSVDSEWLSIVMKSHSWGQKKCGSRLPQSRGAFNYLGIVL